MKITVLTDDPRHWFVPLGEQFVSDLKKDGHDAKYIFSSDDIEKGEVLFILGCSKILPEYKLKLNRHNIVTHGSDLPKGKGFQPVQWQILAGKSAITITLFEAVAGVDAGPIYFKRQVELSGTELYSEIVGKLAESAVDMCRHFIANMHILKPANQSGEESFYPRMKKENYRLDINKTIKDQFNLFRITDNDRFPVYFENNGCTYILKIFKEKK